jgi:fido (protein-threonine AMPylation protein)
MPGFSTMPEVFVSSSGLAAAVSREVKIGRLRKLGSRLYTRNLKEPPEKLVQRNLWPLVASYLPGALIADRTALENRPAPDGSVFLIPRSLDELAALLKSRHAAIMEGRPDKGPGQFKTDPNRAGSTPFVAPELLQGTLAKGFEIYRGLTSPLHRAVFMMFLISEVHPFADGNGRVARIMMNAELVAAGENRIIVPTVFRNDYLMALKALSQNKITGALVRVMDFAQRYTSAVDFQELQSARVILERTNAFADPNEADAAGIRLILPTPEILAEARPS